ncbi:hypothetical protein MASR2M12_24600 [Bacteroidales bacterium]
MPFVEEIIKHKTVSIVGLDKDTGKTECLKYILNRLQGSGHRVAVTSIGIDGEGVSQISGNEKPEIALYPGMVFVTSERHYKERQLGSEILDLSTRTTSLGRLVTARCLMPGKVMFSGPADTVWLRSLLDELPLHDVDTTFVDGALSRLSPGSPAITEAMILTTGAAVSANLRTLVSKTKYIHRLIGLEKFDSAFAEALLAKESGIWAVQSDGIDDLGIPSVFMLAKFIDRLKTDANTLYISGALTNKVLDVLRQQPNISGLTLVVRDFTKIFADKESFDVFLGRGGKIKVLLRTSLKAVCVNPVSPDGFALNSQELCKRLSEEIAVPVYDIKQI